MFRFFKRKKSSDDTVTDSSVPADLDEGALSDDAAQPGDVAQPDESVERPSGVASAEPAPAAVQDAVDSAAVPAEEQLAPALAFRDEPSVSADDEAAKAEPSGSGPIDIDTSAEPPTEASSDVTDSPPAPVAAQAPAPAAGDDAGGSWFARLRKGLSRTGQSIGGLFVDVKLDDDLYDELETALIMADAGMDATTQLLDALRAKVRKERLTDAEQARAALRDLLTQHLQPLEKNFPLDSVKPLVVMIAGVNGAGKTTSIGKLANTFQANGAHVLLAAGDTFRAAAREQLMEWGSRNNVTVIAQEGGDPAAVAFDAVNAGRARQADVVMIDTAGRLPTQLHLMEELKKIKRVVNKAEGSAPHEVLLVVDGNSGQNVLAQIRSFDAAIGLTGLVVTKLDGTAKGGILAAVAAGSQGVRPVPVYWIGVGEGIHDLQPFKAHEFAAALIGGPVPSQAADQKP